MAERWLDKPEAQRGREAELAVAKWLMRRGYHVVPSYDYAGLDHEKPPRLQGEAKGYAIPDLDVAKDGDRRWVEVKWKAKPSPTYSSRLTGCKGIVDAHGIAKRLIDQYMTVQRITGTAVWVFVVEGHSGEWLCQKLDTLRSGKEWSTRSAAMGDMVFWPRAAFRLLGAVGRALAREASP